jgi:hypothetical protein
MKQPKYEIVARPSLLSFEFLSKGNKGNISKLVVYTPTDMPNVFNLAFGDKIGDEDLDDLVITDNGDSEKVLATVAATVYEVTTHYKNSWIYATGSTPSRTRLYRMGINKFYHEIIVDFELYGTLPNGEWEEFVPNTHYIAFLIKRKL